MTSDFRFDLLRPPREPNLVKCIKEIKQRKEKAAHVDKFHLVSNEIAQETDTNARDAADYVNKEFERLLRRFRRKSTPELIFSPSIQPPQKSERRQKRPSISPMQGQIGPTHGDDMDRSDSLSVNRRVSRLRRNIIHLITRDAQSRSHKTSRRLPKLGAGEVPNRKEWRLS